MDSSDIAELEAEIQIGQRVRYVPRHAYGDTSHPDCENGIVRSFNVYGEPFVVYDSAVRGVLDTLDKAQGWTAACTDRSSLIPIGGQP